MPCREQRAPFRLAASAFLVLGATVGSVQGQLSDDDIAALQAQGEREGWTFIVDHNDATQYPLNSLAALVEPDGWEKEGEWDAMSVRDDLPPAFDWRDYGACTSVRNQGGCGSCWAFGAIAAVESDLLIEAGWNRDLSEQWLVSCTDAGSCSGGWHSSALKYLTKNSVYDDPCGDSGAVLETDFRYRASDLPCGCPYDHPYAIDGWSYVGWSGGVPSVSQMKQAIFEHGPVAVAVAVDSSFQAYNGGVFNNCGATSINHCVALVGWDDSLGAAGVWILRNSWGGFWGDGGYMYIEYGCAKVGYAAAYTRFTPQDPSGLSHDCKEIAIAPGSIQDDPALASAQSFDLEAILTMDDDWTSTDATVSVDGAIYQHSTLDSSVPQTQLWGAFPSLVYDSFFSARNFAVPGFADGPQVTGSSMSAIWFDVPDTGNGNYTIGRFTVTSGTTLTVTGTSTSRNGQGDLQPFDFSMPIDIEPPCQGDINNDGLRDQSDLGILLASYEVDGGGDIDGDGDTDQSDLGLLLAVYEVPCR
ncbi:MAG: C1 family peptidase [Phycisphaerales bacterium JB038]